MPYVKISTAAKELGVCVATIRTLVDAGEIKSIRSPGNHRLVDIKSYSGSEEEEPEKLKYIYARVSSNKQKADLERQVERLQEEYPDHKVIKEISSVINFKRKGLRSLVDKAIKGMVGEIVVTNRDRLCRIAWEHFSWLFESCGVNLIVLNQQEQSKAEELNEDLLTIIHVFSCRHYGARSRRRVEKVPNEDSD